MRNGRNASAAILRIFMVAQNIRSDYPASTGKRYYLWIDLFPGSRMI
jgi:hypothetical protein